MKAPNGVWVHTTQWEVPAHTRIDVTALQYDSGSPLRNQFWGHFTGIADGHYTIHVWGEKGTHQVGLVNSYDGYGVGHTFTIPTLGVNVALYGVNPDAKDFCSDAPCSLDEAHNTIKFSFTTPGPGQYRWQCFIPCGVGYFDGNGGPMATLGYMAGWLKVLPQGTHAQ